MAPGRTRLRSLLTSPAGNLAVALAVAVVLMLMPAKWTASIRGAAATVLRPGQRAASGLRLQGHRATTWLRSHFDTATRLTEAQGELGRLQRENRQLAAELAAARQAETGSASKQNESEEDRLLQAECVEANVLGSHARAFLGRHQLLDVGAGQRIESGALVAESVGLLDRGGKSQIEPGQLVLGGRHVWGKIVEVGPHTSTVRAVTEAGYRDLVRIGGSSGPQGILEGTGESLARVRLVEVTEPVSVGDPVYTAAGQGVLPVPLEYGEVVRLERPVGAAHWEIWVRPAVVPDELQRVAVLRLQLNPLRIAGSVESTQR